MPRPWSTVAIHDNGEALIPLPASLHRLEPHPYEQLGAPYGRGGSPFRLRCGVIERLLAAQAQLQRHDPLLRLAIFDAWRPVAVQAFMVQQALARACAERGVAAGVASAERDAIEAQVSRFWAPPSEDPATPPPHSTGAAVDLTLADADGDPLAMGGEIDAIEPVSEPDHYAVAAAGEPRSSAALWHQRRCLLARAMAAAGFSQHPHEWWHFSHGDQLWAWRSNQPVACYGRWPAAALPA